MLIPPLKLQQPVFENHQFCQHAALIACIALFIGITAVLATVLASAGKTVASTTFSSHLEPFSSDSKNLAMLFYPIFNHIKITSINTDLGLILHFPRANTAFRGEIPLHTVPEVWLLLPEHGYFFP